MSEKVLWLDNDRAYLLPYVDELLDQGFEVNVVETAADAERELGGGGYGYAILDVMVPTKSAEEELIYSPDATGLGYRTGVVLWSRLRQHFSMHKVAVLLLTVRLDGNIRADLEREGLPRENFATKYQLSDPATLVERLRKLKKLAEAS